jgi:(p)ppGpp synthase/HD superfamily hydrolase
LAIVDLLHAGDEDQGGTGRLGDSEHSFDPRFARAVAACSDSLADTHAGEVKMAWELREQAYIEHLRTAHPDVLQVSLADKVHNARSILRDFRKRDVGAAIWSRFSQPRGRTLWYYDGLAETFCSVFDGQEPNQQLAQELREIVDVLKTES